MQHLREILLHYYILEKSGAEMYYLLVEVYGDYALLDGTCKI